MPRLTCNVNRSAGAGWGRGAALAAALVLAVSTAVNAQSRPPLPNEPVATEGTTKQFYRGLNIAVVKTIDGFEHAYNFAKGLIGQGGKDSGVDPLEGLREGTHVAIHYSLTGAIPSAHELEVSRDGGLSITEAVITHIDRGRKEIAIRFTDGHTERLQMISRDTTDDPGIVNESGTASARIIVYYPDESGRQVGHYFTMRQ